MSMRIEDMTVEELIAEYNRYGPVEPIERWDGGRVELERMVRVASKQSTPDGVVSGVSLKLPR